MSDCGVHFSSSISNVNSACISAEQFEQGLESSASTITQPLKSFLVELEDIVFAEKIFRLHTPMFVTVSAEDGVWYCENKDLSSLAFGATAEQAVYSFCEDFSVLWDEIAMAPDEMLTLDAQRVKNALLTAVKNIETVPIRCR
jgi:hypothetical protein